MRTPSAWASSTVNINGTEGVPTPLGWQAQPVVDPDPAMALSPVAGSVALPYAVTALGGLDWTQSLRRRPAAGAG